MSFYAVLLTTNLLACSTEQTISSVEEPTSNNPKNITFIAFGDGGYHVDYPKLKDVEKRLSKQQYINNERQEWLEEHRPIEEFETPPLYIIPETNSTIEQGGSYAVGQAMASLCQRKACDFAIQLGDNIYPDGADANDGKDDQKRMDDLLLAPLKPLLSQSPELVIYSALGNHDWKSSRKGVALQTQWMAEQANFHLDAKGYYSYTQGEPGNDVEFFVLDTNMLLSGQTFYEVPLNPDGSEQNIALAVKEGKAELEHHSSHELPLNGEDITQLKWLEQGLKSSTAKWKIVYGHHILWSIGGTKYDEGHVLRKLILPNLCQYADAYIAGHEHDLELLSDDCSLYDSETENSPLPLIISGAASKMRGKHTPFAEQQAKRYPQYQLLWSKSFTWGFSSVTLNNKNDTLQVTFYSTPQNGSGELITESAFSFEHRSF
ncbi:hypothetical protein GCM10009111_21310 [Colwellia asteriadis]|uniref:Calcineurin-like phosphoesterase domain-containing protein n=1 Tax=Colwellia asteriadis TaxID=517723 RepID=A0ABN1L7R3_9GAMM